MYKTLSQAENDFLSHINMFGSDAYPIQKVGNGRWIWLEFWGVQGPPVVYKTRKACAEAIECYLQVLADKAAGRLPPSSDALAA